MGSQAVPVVVDITEAAQIELRRAWQQYQAVEKHGLNFGRVCYDWRTRFKAQGQKGKGLLATLQEVGIPIRTAYYWIHRYEESIGEREIKVKEEKWAKAFCTTGPVKPTPAQRPSCNRIPAVEPRAQTERTGPCLIHGHSGLGICPVCLSRGQQVVADHIEWEARSAGVPKAWRGKPCATISTNRVCGMGLWRLRKLAEELQIPCVVSIESGTNRFKLKLVNLSERGIRELLNYINSVASARRSA